MGKTDADDKIRQAVEEGSKLDYTSEEGRARLIAQTKLLEAEIAKTEAERLSVVHMDERAEADHVKQMEAQGFALDFARLNKTVAEINTRREERAEKIALTGNRFNHFYAYNEPVTARSVTECIDQLVEWQRLAPIDQNGVVEPMTVTGDHLALICAAAACSASNTSGRRHSICMWNWS